MKDITASIVLYNTPISEITLTLTTLKGAKRLKHIYIIDNSTSPILDKSDYEDDFTTYIFNSKNIGYGRAHNIAIRKALKEKNSYHVVLNTDIEFSSQVINELGEYMDQNIEVGQIMPKIVNIDGSNQYLCKLIPSPLDLFARRFLPKSIFKQKRKLFTLENANYNSVMNIPNLSGCFMFLRASTLNDIGIFDERFLLYAEDVDLTRRIHSKYKTIYYPKATVTHYAKHESYTNYKVMIIHISSLVKYFNKWGWFNDEQKDDINTVTLNNYTSINNNSIVPTPTEQ
ncbi:glycosyltransferase family 2 protein [Halosquirtibacter xylanolyticus]|uniref:glycosyltransferase n=1 Tax=Halosquirtibacter xylanolyticus TaxID=3374599 RepID=UPI0037488A84|nr:glycosyltransferase family 2 protein [Prolixibacteraceae bacterium]